jgi:outer membrane protein OmpA-like peptidoglycan-associated protein
MPARPAWVDEQRAQMSAPQPPQRPDREAAPTLRPLPDWVKENRAQIAPPQAPEPPTPPVRAMQGDAVTQAPMRDTGAQADRPAPPQKPTPPAPMADLHRPWRGAPHGGWHRPYGGWNNGWAPWSGGWGGNNWWPWSGGWGRGYNYGAYRPYHPPAAPMRMPMPAPRQQVPADADADGVADGTDLCPDTAAGVAVDALGCDNAARIVLRGVNFKTDSDELTPESLAILDGVSATLAANPGIKVMVAGHTDSDGEDAYNKDLSQRRAQRVVDYLAEQGVDSRNMIAKGFGEEQPVVGNDTPEGKAQNRRVELNRL